MDPVLSKWNKLNQEQRAKLLDSLDPADKQSMIAYLIDKGGADFLLGHFGREKQILEHGFNEELNTVLWLAGRGFGKTFSLTWNLLKVIEHYWHIPLYIGVVNKNHQDVMDINLRGESGFIGCLSQLGYKIAFTDKEFKRKAVKIRVSTGSAWVEFTNGTRVSFYSAQKPDAFAGRQFHALAFDELALYEKGEDIWKMTSFTVRLPEINPFRLIATTPRPKKFMRDLVKEPKTRVITGNLYENKSNLAPAFVEQMLNMFDGTRLGKQEIYGGFLDDNPDALWDLDMIEDQRRPKFEGDLEQNLESLDLHRTVIAIDPAMSSGENADETGIVVAGKTVDSEGKEHVFVIEDASGKYSPEKMSQKVAELYYKYRVDRVIAEKNQGGDLVESTLRTSCPHIPYSSVWAKKGKRTRAEPIAALYEQGKVSHIGHFPKLEDQMLLYSPDNYDGSPDRLDALVYALTELMLSNQSSFYVIDY